MKTEKDEQLINVGEIAKNNGKNKLYRITLNLSRPGAYSIPTFYIPANTQSEAWKLTVKRIKFEKINIEYLNKIIIDEVGNSWNMTRNVIERTEKYHFPRFLNGYRKGDNICPNGKL